MIGSKSQKKEGFLPKLNLIKKVTPDHSIFSVRSLIAEHRSTSLSRTALKPLRELVLEYKESFGHSVPSYALMTLRAISGTRLKEQIQDALDSGQPVQRWACMPRRCASIK